MSQPDLFQHAPRFDSGIDLTPADQIRLTKQQERLVAYMAHGNWRTLREIEIATGIPQASASAQLRHIQREKFGSHVVEKENRGGGLWVYRLVGEGR